MYWDTVKSFVLYVNRSNQIIYTIKPNSSTVESSQHFQGKKSNAHCWVKESRGFKLPDPLPNGSIEMKELGSLVSGGLGCIHNFIAVLDRAVSQNELLCKQKILLSMVICRRL